jgi:integrase
MAKKFRITNSSIADLEADPAKAARGTDTFFWDGDLTGFGVKISQKGSKTFVYQYRASQGDGLPSKPRRMGLGACDRLSASAAREKAQRAFTALADGRDPLEKRRAAQGSPSVEALSKEWLGDLEARAKRGELSIGTLADYEGKLRVHILPAIGTKKVVQLDRAEIEAFHANMREKSASEELIKGVLRVLSAMFGFAVKKGRMAGNPAARMGQFQAAGRQRFLSEAETARLGDALEAARESAPHWTAAVELLLLTGARKSEILNLRWSQITDQQMIFKQHKTSKKTGEKRLPISSEAAIILKRCEAWRREGCDFVFPSVIHRNIAIQKAGKPVQFNSTKPMSAGGFKRFWAQICKSAKLTGADALRPHDLRHSFASVAISNGIGLALIGKNLGHTDTATTQRYAHIADAAAAQAAEENAARIAGRLRGSKRAKVLQFPGR